MKPRANITDSSHYDLGRLTDAERLWVWRHRQLRGVGFNRPGDGPRRININKAEAADRLGITEADYGKLEVGGTPILSAAALLRVAEAMAGPPPTRAELCLVARRRCGLSLADVKEEANTTHVSWLKHEFIGAPAVVAFWEKRGFRFP